MGVPSLDIIYKSEMGISAVVLFAVSFACFAQKDAASIPHAPSGVKKAKKSFVSNLRLSSMLRHD